MYSLLRDNRFQIGGGPPRMTAPTESRSLVDEMFRVI